MWRTRVAGARGGHAVAGAPRQGPSCARWHTEGEIVRTAAHSTGAAPAVRNAGRASGSVRAGDPVPSAGGPVQSAIAASNLRDLSPGTIAELTEGAVMRHVVAGSILHREGDVEAHFELVTAGFLRVYVAAPDGRTMTVRYCRPGAILGAVSLFAERFSLPATIQALVETDVLALRPEVVRRLAQEDGRVAQAVLRELSERVLAFIAEIPGSAFGTVRQRIARHLLDLASERQRGTALVAPVSQQELAEAVGTVREVIVRALRELRTEELVRTGRGGIEILAPERLLAETHADPTTSRSAAWNRSS
jgi:CRP/FNR family transcriptional regulator, cyclic AMP receptor protein